MRSTNALPGTCGLRARAGVRPAASRPGVGRIPTWIRGFRTARVVVVRETGGDTVPTVPTEPATKADLAELATKTELKIELAKVWTELGLLRKDLGEGLAQLNADLRKAIDEQSADTARRISASAEETRDWFRVLADKLDAMNANHVALRTDFEKHRDDTTVHRAPRRSRAR